MSVRSRLWGVRRRSDRGRPAAPLLLLLGALSWRRSGLGASLPARPRRGPTAAAALRPRLGSAAERARANTPVRRAAESLGTKPLQLDTDGRGGRLLRKLDSSTKWLVTLGQTGAVVVRRDMVAPYMIIGGIAASFITSVLKKLLNQGRPAGAPFTDPGMPSSHALVGTFVAAAWAFYTQSLALAAALLPAAAVVSVLRVACGYHTWAQVSVGTALGAVMAYGWMRLGAAWVLPRSDLLVPIYAVYILGSVAFVTRQLLRKKIGRSVL